MKTKTIHSIRSHKKIGIIGAENETHTMRMKNTLEGLGCEVTVIDTVAFPERSTVSIYDKKLNYNGIDVNDIKSFYVRNVFYSHPPYDLEEVKEGKHIDLDGWYSNYVSERERQALLSSWIKYLSFQGKLVVNPIESFDLHYEKPFQVALLRDNGIPMPRTLVTNDAGDLLRFRKEVPEIVFKPVAGGAICRKMEQKDWKKERLELLKNAPVLFQEYIEGVNIRAYVIGNKVVSSGIIHTEAVDYRGKEEGIEKITLPKPIQAMCVKAMKLCGMKFTGVDVKRKPDGKYVFIECNPSPMFVGFQSVVGDPIDEYLADYLMNSPVCG